MDEVKQKPLKVGDRVRILLDPLSHGKDMSSLKISAEIINCDDMFLYEGNTESQISVAVFRILTQNEVELGGGESVSFGNWNPSMVDRTYIIVSIDKAAWMHMAWNVKVDFMEEPA